MKRVRKPPSVSVSCGGQSVVKDLLNITEAEQLALQRLLASRKEIVRSILASGSDSVLVPKAGRAEGRTTSIESGTLAGERA